MQPTGVPAELLVDAVRLHLDPAHDLARRLGCSPQQAVSVVARSALDLVDVVAATPEAVPDEVGWWMARTRVLAAETRGAATGGGRGELATGGGVLATDDDQRLLAAALDQLDEPAQVALLLRDAYGLPAASVAAALFAGTADDRAAEAALEQVAEARLALLAQLDDEQPVATDHVPLAALGRIGEGGQHDPHDAAARRHAASCRGCRLVTDVQQRAHLLLTGLALAALPEAEHARVMATVTERAQLLLQQPAAPRAPDRWLVSPLMAAAGVVLALGAGVGVGLLLSRDAGPATLLQPDGSLPAGTRLVSPSPRPSPVPTSVASVAPSPPQTSVFVLSPRPARPVPTQAAPAPG